MEDYSFVEPELRPQPGRCTSCHLETTDLRFHRCPSPVDERTIPGTCDWGDCDELTVMLRLSPYGSEWLAVCEHHAQEAGAALRPLPRTKRVDEMTLEEYETWLASNPTSGFLCSCGEVFDSRRELEEHYWGHIPTPEGEQR